jgi:hypothetical protein
MLKYVSKFALDILPSVVATIIGAYIVNHYIAARPGADSPLAAAVSSADPKKANAKPSGTSALANIPEPGVKAKGISERAMLERSAAEQPAAVEKPQEKLQEKSADKPAETASIPVETRRHQPLSREKTIAKAAPAPVQPSTPVSTPVAAAPNAPVEAATPAEERRDANDLARAAIERLRGANEGAPRAQEATRVPDAPRIADTARIPEAPRVVSAPSVAAPVVSAPPVRPLPPPIMVSSPSAETSDPATGSLQMRPAYPATVDPRRPTPPADIPEASRPLDLRAEAVEPQRREHTTVAEDVLSAAKSVFHAVLPK